MSFDYVMETTCTQIITILYKYFYVWELNFRLNNINFYFFIIDICIDYKQVSSSFCDKLVVVCIQTKSMVCSIYKID